MVQCPYCGSDTFILGRKHTIWETFTVTVPLRDGSYTEEDAGAFGETIEQGPWEEATCARWTCQRRLDITAIVPDDNTP